MQTPCAQTHTSKLGFFCNALHSPALTADIPTHTNTRTLGSIVLYTPAKTEIQIHQDQGHWNVEQNDTRMFLFPQVGIGHQAPLLQVLVKQHRIKVAPQTPTARTELGKNLACKTLTVPLVVNIRCLFPRHVSCCQLWLKPTAPQPVQCLLRLVNIPAAVCDSCG